MYNWKNAFNKTDLENSHKFLSKLSKINIEEDLITADVKTTKTFHVTVSSKDGILQPQTCTCSKKANCVHMAALLTYIEEHSKDFNILSQEDQELKELIDRVDEKSIKNFLLNEIVTNDELKDKFMESYQKGRLIDRQYYIDKLDNIISSAEVGDFHLHETHDIRYIGTQLYEFISEDVLNLMVLGEDNLACELLNKLAFILLDDLNYGEELWYDCAEIFDENAAILLTNEKADEELLKELEKNFCQIEI